MQPDFTCIEVLPTQIQKFVWLQDRRIISLNNWIRFVHVLCAERSHQCEVIGVKFFFMVGLEKMMWRYILELFLKFVGIDFEMWMIIGGESDSFGVVMKQLFFGEFEVGTVVIGESNSIFTFMIKLHDRTVQNLNILKTYFLTKYFLILSSHLSKPMTK